MQNERVSQPFVATCNVTKQPHRRQYKVETLEMQSGSPPRALYNRKNWKFVLLQALGGVFVRQ